MSINRLNNTSNVVLQSPEDKDNPNPLHILSTEVSTAEYNNAIFSIPILLIFCCFFGSIYYALKLSRRFDINNRRLDNIHSNENPKDTETKENKMLRSKVLNLIMSGIIMEDQNFIIDEEDNSIHLKLEQKIISSDSEDAVETRILMTSGDCPICMEAYKLNDTIVISECSHLFHQKCILEWAMKKDECPTCRQSMWNPETYKASEKNVIMQHQKQKEEEKESNRMKYINMSQNTD